MIEFVDLFAGLGGLSLGAEHAGLRPVWASNHNQRVCDVYERNHGLKPICQCLRQADWTTLPRHDWGLMAPSCQGHTKARGKERPQHDIYRATMWACIEYLEINRVPVAVLENVPEILDWVLWPSFVHALRSLGYSIAPHVLDAADFGVPQNRVRVLAAITRSKAPLRLRFRRRGHVPARKMIDWTADNWTAVAAKGEATRARIQQGRKKFGRLFLAPYYSSGSGTTGRSIDRPIGTISTHDRWLLVDGDRCRFLTVGEIRAFMGFPESFWLPDSATAAKHMLGNAVPPPMARDFITALKEAA
ncbi:MAG TPA: DNA cytosine methyltransferase [Lacunisphaera sp.]|nr:DNA cytosine methyltransferase [Lacunisphaera sp.]